MLALRISQIIALGRMLFATKRLGGVTCVPSLMAAFLLSRMETTTTDRSEGNSKSTPNALNTSKESDCSLTLKPRTEKKPSTKSSKLPQKRLVSPRDRVEDTHDMPQSSSQSKMRNGRASTKSENGLIEQRYVHVVTVPRCDNSERCVRGVSCQLTVCL